MKITQTNDSQKGSFKATQDGEDAGIMTYVWTKDNVFTIEHTIGKPEFKGVGKTLLNAAVEFARDNNYKIIPECPFAKKMFERMPEIQDVLAA